MSHKLQFAQTGIDTASLRRGLLDAEHNHQQKMGNSRSAVKHRRGYKPTKRKSTSKGIKKTLGKQARDPTVR